MTLVMFWSLVPPPDKKLDEEDELEDDDLYEFEERQPGLKTHDRD